MIAFSGTRSGTAPLTWGQRAIWDTIQRTAPDDHYFNFGRVLEIPRGARPASVDRVTRAVGLLVERHESLRTLVGPGPCQDLRERGELPVRMAPGEDPAEVLTESCATRFDYEREWPLRVALVTAGPQVTHVVLAFCHLAADGLGAEQVVRDLRLLLLRGSMSGTPAQPYDLALWQESAVGRRQAANAAAHWEREHRRMPSTMFHVPSGSSAQPPVWRATLTSPAADLAAQRIAVRHGTSSSTVLLTAVSALVAEMTGHETVAVLTIAANRVREDTRTAVTTLSQEGLFVLDMAKGGFGDLLTRAWPAVLRAYRSAYHDPADRDRVVAEASRERGTPVHPNCCFNDMRLAATQSSPDQDSIRAALDGTKVDWPLSQDKLNCRFCVHVTEGSEIWLTADTRWLSRPDMERFLVGLERLLVETALR